MAGEKKWTGKLTEDIIEAAFQIAVYRYSIDHLRDDPNINENAVEVCISMYEDTEKNIRKRTQLSKEDFNMVIEQLTKENERFSEETLKTKAKELIDQQT